MTYGEIVSVADYFTKTEKAEIKFRRELAAFTAYYSGIIPVLKHPPQSMEQAFPWIFGRTATGGVDVNDWERGKAEMAKFAAMFGCKEKGGGE